jgi:triacylglycerol lipase
MNNYPVILAHGIARFDFLLQRFSKDLGAFGIDFGLASDGLNYFKGIARHLRNHGFDVYQSSVSFAAGVERRAADLKREIETALALRPGKMKVHIIAHSMGGLDARHMIVKLGMAETVASLTTIGTPHLGTSFADWGMQNQGNHVLEVVGSVADLGGFADLTTDACAAFNESARAAEAANAVVYQTYASAEAEKQIFALLQPSWRIINDAEGDNDGLVPRSSQMWQSELTGDGGAVKTIRQNAFPVSADHLNEIGWWDANQLPMSDLWHTNFFQIAQNYERSIRDVYLDIARGVTDLA